MPTSKQKSGRMASVMQSYEGLPNWVKIWMNLILGPVNLVTLAFLDQPNGTLIAILAIGGMILTVAIVIASGGFTKLASVGHIVLWTPLVYMLIFARPEGAFVYQTFLTVLLVINMLSLVFDFNDLRIWISSKIKS